MWPLVEDWLFSAEVQLVGSVLSWSLDALIHTWCVPPILLRP